MLLAAADAKYFFTYNDVGAFVVKSTKWFSELKFIGGYGKTAICLLARPQQKFIPTDSFYKYKCYEKCL